MDMGKNPTPFFNYLWDLEPINSSNPQILQLQKKVNYWMVIKNILDGYKEKTKIIYIRNLVCCLPGTS